MKSAIIPVLTLLCLIYTGCYRGSGEWQLERHDVEAKLAFTIRLKPSYEKERTIVFDDIHSGTIKPRFYSLPGDAHIIPNTELTFHDTTLLPGRVTLKVNDHVIDIMQRNIIVDGIEHDWNVQELIKLNKP